jgi:acyl-CoA reductase-like NAD-dependent aldehyde dehydrogenase
LPRLDPAGMLPGMAKTTMSPEVFALLNKVEHDRLKARLKEAEAEFKRTGLSARAELVDQIGKLVEAHLSEHLALEKAGLDPMREDLFADTNLALDRLRAQYGDAEVHAAYTLAMFDHMQRMLAKWDAVLRKQDE